MTVLALTLALLPLNHFQPSANVKNAPATEPAVQADSAAPTVSVHRHSMASAVDAQGYFEPIDPFEVRIRPKAYAGELTITSVAADGKTVKKGDVILEIDPVTIDKQIAAAENDALAAHATLTRAQTDAKIGQQQEELSMRVQTDATRRAQEEVKWWQNVDGPHVILEADLAVKTARANADDQQDELNELKKMYKADDLSNDTADIVVKRAVRNLERSKIILKVQEEQQDKVKRFIYPAQQQQVLDSAKQSEQALELLKTAQAQSKVIRETGLVTALTNTKAVDEKLSDLKLDKEKLTVRAPADGVVLYGQLVNGAFQGADDRTLRIGEKIAPQQAVMTFYAPGELRLHMDLPEAKFFAARPQAKAAITPVAYTDLKLTGTCDANPPLAVNTQQGTQYRLTISCADVDKRLAPGMRANVHIDALEADDMAIVVPTSAVADGCVWVKTDDGCERHPVVVGKSNDKQTEITKGLNDGDVVLVEAKK